MRCRSLVWVLVLVLAGCGSLLGRRYDNFSAYYNKYYNAEDRFDEGVDGAGGGAQGEKVDADRFLPLFGQSNRASQSQAFNDAIEKSADLLRKHPDSKWVDDALLLIGKSYFYLENWAGAEQKFREVMTLGQTRLDDEARFWLARTLIASGAYDAAAAHLTESLAREDLESRWEARLRLALAELHVQRRAWDDAVAELDAGLEAARDKKLAARAQFLRGQLLETLGRPAEAVEAYQAVLGYNPFYELSYAAQVAAVRVEGLHGDPEAALSRLRRMERDDKNYANRAELAYLRGRIYQAMSRPDDALDAYYELLYDSDANISTVRGRVHYALGVFFRDVEQAYTLAAAHFDTAAQALRVAPQGAGRSAPIYAPAAIIDAEEQARTFGSFADVSERVQHLDSLLYLGSLDDEAFAERLLELRRQRAEELEAQREALERQQRQQGFQQAANAGLAPGRTKQVDDPTATAEAGFLFYKDPIRVQEAMASFIAQWGDRALQPNWRRASALAGVANSPLGQEGVIQRDTFGNDADDLPDIDVSDIPRDSLSRARLRAERAAIRYELGNVLFLAMNRPDSAAAWYRLVIEEADDEDVAQRAYYALAEVQRALGDDPAAERLYRTILDRFPTSDIAGRARERLGMPPREAAADSLARAEAAYEAAYERWQQETYDAALREMIDVAAHFPRTAVAPKALFAAGAVFQAWAARDSLDLFAPLPIPLPDSLSRPGGLLGAAELDIAAPAQEAPAEPDPRASPARPDSLGALPAVERLGEERLGEEGLAEERLALRRPGVAPATPADAVPDAVPDTVPDVAPMAAPDTLAAIPEAEPVALPTAETELEPAPVYLETLYESLLRRYPSAPQVAPARRILAALDERRPKPEAAPDSTTAPDSTLAPPVVAEEEDEDGGRVRRIGRLIQQPDESPTDATEAAAVDTTVAARRAELQQILDERRQALAQRRGAAAQEEAQGAEVPLGLAAWTVVVASTETAEQAGVTMQALQRRLGPLGYRLQLYPPNAEDEPPRFRVGLGRLASEAEARALIERLAAELPPDASVLFLPAAGGARPPVEEPPPDDAEPENPVDAPAMGAETPPAAGGWTIVVASAATAEAAEEALEGLEARLAGQGHELAVYALRPEEGAVPFHVGLGRFAREADARALLDLLAGTLPPDARVLRVPDGE